MRKIIKVIYKKSDGNLFKFIECARIGIRNKYPFTDVVETRVQVDLINETASINYIIEV